MLIKQVTLEEISQGHVLLGWHTAMFSAYSCGTKITLPLFGNSWRYRLRRSLQYVSLLLDIYVFINENYEVLYSEIIFYEKPTDTILTLQIYFITH